MYSRNYQKWLKLVTGCLKWLKVYHAKRNQNIDKRRLLFSVPVKSSNFFYYVIKFRVKLYLDDIHTY